ncbi:MAG: hypothetical protein NTV80_03620 [Verrucomicrobia bacterium]|nr:hypothetical protein [Verrucomicrobiota bacterium]
MKGILVLIIAAALGYLSYQYAYPILSEYVKFEKHKKQEIVVAPAPKPFVKKVVAVVEPPKPVMEQPKPEPKPVMVPKPEPMPEPVVIDPNAFIAPVIPSIEEATKNWAALPKSAFPRQVTMKRDLELSMKVGNNTASTKVKAGGSMFAVGQDGANIFVSPSDTSPMKGSVSLEDTDLKEVLSKGYEVWKVTYVATLKRAHEFKLAAAERAKNAPPPTPGAKAGNDKPAKDKDGTYPLLLTSMKSGQVTEIKPAAIKEWGEPVLTDGVWTVTVKYETETMFGKFDTEAQAFVKNGAVEKWIYTGSGEVVP